MTFFKIILFDFFYCVALVLALPYFIFRVQKNKKYLRNPLQRLGLLPKYEQSIWIHANSVGEINSVVSLANILKNTYPTISLVITTNTPAGFDTARKHLSTIAFVAHAPIDLGFCIKKTINNINPLILLSVESDLWPNRFLLCQRNQIPVVIINARLSERSLKHYLLVPGLAKTLANGITAVIANSRQVANRYTRLGVSPNKIHLTEDLKLSNTIQLGLRK